MSEFNVIDQIEKSIASDLKERRLELGLGRPTAAKMSSVSKTTIQDIESNRYPLTLSSVCRLAITYEMNLAELLTKAIGQKPK